MCSTILVQDFTKCLQISLYVALYWCKFQKSLQVNLLINENIPPLGGGLLYEVSMQSYSPPPIPPLSLLYCLSWTYISVGVAVCLVFVFDRCMCWLCVWCLCLFAECGGILVSGNQDIPP